MLGNAPFYFSLIRKYVALFGSTFDNIYIERTLLPNYTPDTTKNQLIKVPIEYANKDKMIVRLEEDPNIDRPYSELLPRMSFEMLDITYDNSRKQPTTNYNAKLNSNNAVLSQYVGVPYNFRFALYVAAKNLEDGTKIIEQILPFFTPDFSFSLNLIPEMGITQNIPIIRENISCEDKYDGSFKVRRSIIWTLHFTLKGWLYGPITVPGIIKTVLVNFRIANTANIQDAVGNTAISEAVTTQVTLTSNGQPTDCAANSIPVADIIITDDYGFASYITNYQSGDPNDEGAFI